MKSTYISFTILTLIAFVSGCASFPVATRTVTYSAGMNTGDVIELTIDVARELKYPPATKIDKTNGLVEFGGFEQPELGLSAQVRVKSPGELEVNVKHGSVYVTLSAEKPADEFKTRLEARLAAGAAR